VFIRVHSWLLIFTRSIERKKTDMAYTINGIGTRYYGRRAAGHGTYIATKWIVLFYLPLIPLRSYRIFGETSPTYSGFGIPHVGISHSVRRTMTLSALPNLHSRQVLATYAGVALFLLYSLAVYWLAGMPMTIFLGLIPLALLGMC
jgi:hypothetical protein